MPNPLNHAIAQATGTELLDGTVAVEDTAVQLTATATLVRSVLLLARSANTGTVTVGADNGIVSAAAGYTLGAGDPITIDIDDLSKVWLIGSAPGQNVDYLAVR